jgi:hypothetical protein
MSEIFIVNDFAGVQKGTKDNPYSVKTASEFDALIASQIYDENHWHRRGTIINLGGGEFLTGGCYEWGPFANYDRPRIGPDWQIIGTGPDTIISLDPNAIPDEQVNDWPLHILCSAGQWQQYLWWGREAEWAALAPEDLWKGLSQGQLVKDLTLRLNYSKLIDRWIGKGFSLKLSGAVLQGHGAACENVSVRDFGAHRTTDKDGQLVGAGAESFPLIIAGAVDGFDRNKLAKLSNTDYVYDSHLTDEQSAHHTGCKFYEFSDADSNDQVSLCVITTSIGQPSLPSNSAGDDVAPYVHHFRKFAYQKNNTADLPTSSALANQVQGFTQYQTLRGDCSSNLTRNVSAGYYSDFYKSQGVDVHDNQFLRCIRGAAFLLSPSGPDYQNFTSEGHKVRRNIITQVPINVGNDWNAGVLLWKFTPDKGDMKTRYMRNFIVGGQGDENTISIDGAVGVGNIGIKADGIDGLDASTNKISVVYSNRTVVAIRCTAAKLPPEKPSLWRRFINFFKHLFGR